MLSYCFRQSISQINKNLFFLKFMMTFNAFKNEQFQLSIPKHWTPFFDQKGRDVGCSFSKKKRKKRVRHVYPIGFFLLQSLGQFVFFLIIFFEKNYPQKLTKLFRKKKTLWALKTSTIILVLKLLVLMLPKICSEDRHFL
jgi:hypothetical protein